MTARCIFCDTFHDHRETCPQEPYMGRTTVSGSLRYQFRPASLMALLRAKTTDFQRGTYTALQQGTATEHQQRAAASGIVLRHADYAEAADTIEVLVAEVLRLTEALAWADSEGCEWPDDPMPDGCIARRLLDGFALASAGEAGTAATTKIDAVHEHATAESGDAQNIAQDIGGPSQ